MIVLPAIDLLDGRCVRLQKGAYETAEKVAEDPYETIQSFARAGAEYIHVVDLDGAKEGAKVNHALIGALAKAVSVPLEVGGGVRDMETIGYYVDAGISRVILGSIALKNPDFVKTAVKEYGDKIAVGIDAMQGMVRTAGWLEESDMHYLTLAQMMDDVGVKNIIYTDIQKDGMLAGVDAAAYDALNKAVAAEITASGGVKDITDIQQLKEIGIYGVICGKAIYTGSLDLEEAIRVGREA
ncbi:MAG: 1-(5-phosphoribosyl)-5-[(5-phosphoribosylamino)methylideneamino]imidazole-4-carboxamide isomerase [Christensenellaceae bacterium]|jgi:phosphoribosylformimino-5-aminoimidazole carboxamide ribotide isomerase